MDAGRLVNQAAKCPISKELLAFRPRVDEIPGALAREAVCVADRLDEAGHGLDLPGRKPPFGIVRLERERLVFEDFQGRLIEQVEANKNDWHAIVRVYEDAHSHKPKSVLLESTMLPAGAIRSVGTKIDRFDALVPAGR